MSRNIGFFVLAGAVLLELLAPGWNGVFAERDPVDAQTQRILVAIYATGAMVLLSGNT